MPAAGDVADAAAALPLALGVDGGSVSCADDARRVPQRPQNLPLAFWKGALQKEHAPQLLDIVFPR